MISIIGILIALLLPAVQAAREAARRMQCTYNVKQIGLALHMHLEAYQVFPRGHVWDPSGKVRGKESSWVTYLLPYLEQNAVYDAIKWDEPFGCGEGLNKLVMSTPLSALLCPSNERVKLLVGDFTRGTYAANNGIGPMRERAAPADFPPQRKLGSIENNISLAGVFFLNSRLSAAEITDGLSNTAFISEVIAVPGDDVRGMLHYPEGPLYHHNHAPNSTVPDEIRTSWCISTKDAPCMGKHQDYNDRMVTLTARSMHSGGVNVLRGDGSVAFISNSIDIEIWQSICTPRTIPGEKVLAGF